MKKREDLVAVLSLVAIWALVVALVGLGGDYALNDDWAYAYTARHLVHTGHLRILDWAAPSLASHAVWGAAALRLLGDSQVSLRAGTLVWALVAILCLYGLARHLLAPRAAAVVSLAMALSPWFVNLSFTYMTDVPWLAMMLAALLCFVRALDSTGSSPPRPLFLLLSGTLIGIAALTRQLSLITTPAFALVLLRDARRRGPRWLWPTAWTCLLLGAPVAALFFPFQHWYTHVHGVTVANRDTVRRILDVRLWNVLVHVISVVHYAGLWLFPVALALLLRRKLGEVVTRAQAAWVVGIAGLYALVRPIAWFPDAPSDVFHRAMPFLGNVFYPIGLGPPTLTDTYWGESPLPHPGFWLSVLLTIASTFGAAVGAGIFVSIVRRARRAWSEPGNAGDAKGDAVRLLLLFFAGVYLFWHLATATFIFDRYLVPLLPIVFLLGIDAVPPEIARSRAVAGVILASGLFSVAATHEYLSWNDARDRAARALSARGIPDDEVDAGFEVDGPRHFEAYLKRTGKLHAEDYFWMDKPRYRISFWPAHTPECATLDRYPYWTWPGGGSPAIYVLECSPKPPAAVSASGGR